MVPRSYGDFSMGWNPSTVKAFWDRIKNPFRKNSTDKIIVTESCFISFCHNKIDIVSMKQWHHRSDQTVKSDGSHEMTVIIRPHPGLDRMQRCNRVKMNTSCKISVMAAWKQQILFRFYFCCSEHLSSPVVESFGISQMLRLFWDVFLTQGKEVPQRTRRASVHILVHG